MNKAMTENWNSVVGPKDLVFHLGDFAFAKGHSLEAIIKGLNGQWILIAGNHDRTTSLAKAGVKIIGREAYITYKGKILWMNHYNIIQSEYDKETGRPLKRPKARMNWDLCLHGHSHSSPEKKLNWYFNKPCLDVGVEGNNYKPYSIDEVLECCQIV